MSERRGGARKGAGRKPTGRAESATISFRIPPSLRDRLRAYTRRQGIPVRVFVERALDALEKAGK